MLDVLRRTSNKSFRNNDNYLHFNIVTGILETGRGEYKLDKSPVFRGWEGKCNNTHVEIQRRNKDELILEWRM